MNATKTVLALTLSLVGSWAAAATEVRLIEPEKFIDVKDAWYQRQDGLLEDLQAHFKKQADKLLPGKDMTIEITDVDLAGRIEPRRRGMDMIRVLRDMTDGPMITLRYVLSEGGVEVRHGEARLWDGGYLTGFNPYPSGDPLRYEKRMIDNWFQREFDVAR